MQRYDFLWNVQNTFDFSFPSGTDLVRGSSPLTPERTVKWENPRSWWPIIHRNTGMGILPRKPAIRKRRRRKSVKPSYQMNLPYWLKFPPPSSKFARPCGTPRFPFGFRQKISVRRNFLPEKRSEGAGTDVRGFRRRKLRPT